jgi:sugar lactone lactonase YvrE
VVKLDSQGNFVLAWGSSGEGEEQFMETNRIACDSQDNVYVVDTSLNRIQKFDSNGNFIRSWNLPGGGFGLTIDSQDFVYVAGEYFLKYNANGSFIKEWGTPLTDDGRLSGPHGLTVDSLDALYLTEIGVARSLDALYLTEIGVARVQKFNSDGVFITEFGSDRGQGQLNHPLGITIASNGLVYVINVEEAEGHIKIYTPSITEPTVIYPNGGETLNGTIGIQWASSINPFNNSVTYSVYYSTNNGASWNMLISGLKSTSYNWDTTSLLYGVKYRIKVVAYCSIGSTSEDISDDVFTVANNYYSSMINTIIIPIFASIVLLGLLFWMNRLVVRIEEEIMD